MHGPQLWAVETKLGCAAAGAGVGGSATVAAGKKAPPPKIIEPAAAASSEPVATLTLYRDQARVESILSACSNAWRGGE